MILKKQLQKKAFELLTRSSEEWEFTEHRAYHEKTHTSWWIANGLLCFKSTPVIIELGRMYSKKLWKWLKLARLMQVIKYGTVYSEKEEILSDWKQLVELSHN